jgi:hypothetical protein
MVAAIGAGGASAPSWQIEREVIALDFTVA